MTQQKNVAVEDLKQYKVMIGTPMYGGSCTAHYTHASIQLAMRLQAAGIYFGFAFIFNESLITRARNNIAESFMSSAERYTHLMFIDADIDYRPQDVLTALAVQHAHKDKNIICAAYPKKRIAWDNIKLAVEKGIADQDPFILENYVGDFVVGLDESSNVPLTTSDILEVTTAGTGFMLITRQVFEDFNAHYPELKYRPDHGQMGGFTGNKDVMCYFDTGIDPVSRNYISEDYWFMKKARAIGHSAWMIPWINLGHIGSYKFTGNLNAVNALGASLASR